MNADIVETVGWEDTAYSFVRRITGWNGDYITQASITSIAWKVYDLATSTPDQAATGTCTPSAVIFDSLQTGTRWTRDTTGYNFLYTMAGTAFPSGNRYYAVEFTFTPTTGDPFPVVFKHFARPLHGS